MNRDKYLLDIKYTYPYYQIPELKHGLFLVGKEILIQKHYKQPTFAVKFTLEEGLLYGDKVSFFANDQFPYTSSYDFFSQYPDIIFFGSQTDSKKSFVLYDSYDCKRKTWNSPDFIKKYRSHEIFRGKLSDLNDLEKYKGSILRCYRPKYTCKIPK